MTPEMRLLKGRSVAFVTNLPDSSRATARRMQARRECPTAGRGTSVYFTAECREKG